MILSLVVYTDGGDDSGRQAKVDMLQRSYLICNEQRSKEARRVTEALATMLTKLGSNSSNPATAANPKLANNTPPTPPFSVSSTATMSDQLNEFNMSIDPLDNFMNMPENIDWVS